MSIFVTLGWGLVIFNGWLGHVRDILPHLAGSPTAISA